MLLSLFPVFSIDYPGYEYMPTYLFEKKLPGYIDRINHFKYLADYKAVKHSFKNILGIMVPHYTDWSYPMTIDCFKIVRNSKKNQNISIKNIIMIGPNHYHIGKKGIYTTHRGFDTVFGKVETNKSLVDIIVKNNLAEINDKYSYEEYSIRDLMAYVKYFFPDTQVVPLIISNKHFQSKHISLLSRRIFSLVNDNTIFLLSVDMSHYLDIPSTIKEDNKTIKNILTFNYKGIQQCRTELRKGLSAVLMGLKKQKARAHLIEQSNSLFYRDNTRDTAVGFATIIFNTE